MKTHILTIATGCSDLNAQPSDLQRETVLVARS